MSTPRGKFTASRIERLEPRLLLFAGQPDLSFGNLGTAQGLVLAPLNRTPAAVAVDSQGRAVVVGGSGLGESPGQLSAARYLSDGRLDPSFARAGIFDLNRPDFDQGHAISVLIQPNGRVVLFSATYDPHFYAIGLRPDGSLDPTFGAKGIVTGNIAANGATMLPDASFMIGGFVYGAGARSAAYVHLLADGKIDPAYSGGFRTLALKGPLATQNATFDQMQALSDGSAIAAGEIGNDVLIFKITPSGFGTRLFHRDGFATFDFGGDYETSHGVVALPDGDLVLLAQSRNTPVLTRLTPQGDQVDSFGSHGQAPLNLTPTAPTDSINCGDLVLAPDGRLLVVGWSGDNFDVTGKTFVAAVTQRGRLDRSYADGGLATVGFGPQFKRSAGIAAAPAPDGSLVITGEALQIHNPQFGIARLEPDGSFDPSFGAAGVVTTQFVGPVFGGVNTLIARQPDAKIVEMSTIFDNVVFTRFNEDGGIDHTFGDQGTTRIFIGQDEPNTVSLVLTDLTIDSRGRILGLYCASGSPTPVAHVIRLTSKGRLDLAFANAGILDPGFGEQGGDAALGIQGQKLIVASQEFHKLRVRRFDQSGALDQTFGKNGEVEIDSPDVFPWTFTTSIRLALAPDGSIILANQIGMGANPPDDQGPPAVKIRTTVIRLFPEGRVDQSFGNHGIATVDLGTNFGVLGTSSILSMALMPDGRIAVAGNAAGCAVAVFRPDGSLDTSFGDHGIVHTQFRPASFNVPTAIVPTPDGKLLLAGLSSPLGAGRLSILRLTATGQLDRTYGPDGTGTVSTPADIYGGSGNAILQPDGKLLFAADGLQVLRFLTDTDPAISARIESNILKIEGTNGTDRIVLRQTREGIEMVSIPTRFNPAQFSKIQIRANAGNDTIDASSITLPLTIDAGDGNDLVLAGPGDDNIQGGNGHDTIFGGQGNDTLHGNNGNDYLSGGPGQDQLFGDNGNDQLIALDGVTDSIDGGQGFDRTRSDSNDILQNTESLLI